MIEYARNVMGWAGAEHGESVPQAGRAVELDGHPFFVAMLCQPERAALRGITPPLVSAFVLASAGAAISRPSAHVSSRPASAR